MQNLGCKDIRAVTDTNSATSLRIQIAENVKRTLFSVGKLTESGNTVVFDDDGSYIYNKTSGEYTPVYKVHGVYRMNLWVPADQSDPYGTTTGNIVQPSSGNEVSNANIPSDTDNNVGQDVVSLGFLRRLNIR